MKKRFFIALAVVLAVGIVIWYMSPVHIADADPADVGEIVIFNGNNGKLSRITDAGEIEKVMETLHSVRFVRARLAGAHDGFNLDTAIYLKNGERAGGWNDFVINSADSVKAGAFFYKAAGGTIDYDYIEQLAKERQE